MSAPTIRPPATVTGTGEPADRRHPAVRFAALLDPDTVEPLHAPDSSGVHAVAGRIAGHRVLAYCTDATVMGGAMGAAGCRHIVATIARAVRERVPVVGLWHSGGARLADGVESMDAVGQVFAAMTQASGRVPQLSVVLGPAAGAAAYGPALTDLVIMSDQGRMFVTGPDVVRAVTGERVDMESLGGAGAHGPRSGVAHVVVDTEERAYRRARRVAELFAHPGLLDPHAFGADRDLRALLPDRPQRAYDVRPLVRAILDEHPGTEPAFVELQPAWAPNIVVGLGRLAGRTVGVIANNPLRKGGCLDSLSAEKASRFVRMCDSLGVPLLVLVDVPGYLPGVDQEWGGVIRRGAKLLHAFAEATVPRVTLITRKSYGGAYIAMNSRALGATAVFAWPGAEVAVMSAEAAVDVLHRRTLAATAPEEHASVRRRLVDDHVRAAGGVDRALALGVVDEVIDPAHTRRRLARALATAPAGRGHHGNIPL
ncbi:acyl-CoA carboxylase subunit beta [Phytohabitans suffuscus]|uniref:Putative propionyl-CoA carboxylase beta chain 6 n=1 Tax=Phytohabitans suffuscus TaxID=624315 RepID=A0A6F8Y9B3_9ACTN|nr:carboxyl transferase domain-containing protein [Phytohabitans suffuscus]BCB82714.1 putative propionyl-CoA carboxylase beta chain 6 [Phytohabitans suffuscus]